jgi:hypothetical protein
VVFVGRVSSTVTEKQLRAVFASFGPIKSCRLVPEPSPSDDRPHRGFGFIAYDVRARVDLMWLHTLRVGPGQGGTLACWCLAARSFGCHVRGCCIPCKCV